MQAVGGVGGSGGNGKQNWHFLALIVQLQQKMVAVKQIVQNLHLSLLLFVNGLPSLPCGELYIHQQFRWIISTVVYVNT